MWQLALAGLSLGLVGSLHCVGMCGPLALSLPVQHLNRRGQVMALVYYNTGRVVTYSLIGLLLGLAGRSIYLAGWQQWFSIVLGIILLLFSVRFFLIKKNTPPRWLQAFYVGVQALMGRFLQPRPPAGYLLPGIANGLLPCGMVYLALAGALSASRITDSVLFMFFFGAGTMPGMLIMGLLGWRIKLSVRQQWKRIMPFFIIGMAGLLILRGLNLGIPFISPLLAAAPGQAISCHN